MHSAAPRLSVVALACSGACSGACAQPATPDPPPAMPPAESAWSITLTPYVWIPAMSGDITVRGNPAEIDMSVGDTYSAIVDNFDGALLLHLEVRHDRISVFGDSMYLSLESDVSDASGREGQVNLAQGIFELGAGYAVVDEAVFGVPTRRFRLEPIGGLRVNYLELGLEVPSAGLDSSQDQTWIDGFLGARAGVDIADWSTLQFRADFGGGQSQLSWNMVAGVDFRLAHWFSIGAGYRAISIDYQNGSGADEFRYDVVLHGPFLALSFTF